MLRFLSALITCSLLCAQSPTTPPAPQPTPTTPSPQSELEYIDILKGLHQQILTLKNQKGFNKEEQNEANQAIERLLNEFEELLAGQEPVAFFTSAPPPSTLQQELVEIFDPLVGEIKSATANSREKDALRNQLDALLQKKQAIRLALKRIDQTITIAENAPEQYSPALRKLLIAKRKVWQNRMDQAILEYDSAHLQLAQKQKDSVGTVESASRLVARFFKTRGLHLALGISMAVLVWFTITYLYRHFSRISPLHTNQQLHGTAKTIDGLVHIASAFFAVVTLVLTFFLCDDWVLLSATLLVFIGLFWALRNKFADLLEEIRLILNIGSVREGELIIYEGLSWQVDKIRVYCRLINPELDGGEVRIPIGMIAGHHSRPCHPKERFFPTSVNDWVILSDDSFGKVLRQTPEYVELIHLGGARKTYSTQDFIAQTPLNLSKTGFRINSIFGIDYKHQQNVTDDIPSILQQHLRTGIIDSLESSDHLKRVKVELASASASSLDFEILADFNSDAAPKYNELTRVIQRLTIEACNLNGWEIPFNQLTIHHSPQ